MEPADPAFEAVAAESILMRVILPELDFHVLDLVAGDNIGHSEQLLQSRMRQIRVVVKIDPDANIRVQATHLWHASSVFIGLKSHDN